MSDAFATLSQPGILFALAALAIWGAVMAAQRRRRRRGPASEPGYRLRRADSLALTAQHSVHVVEWGHQRWLVGCHASGTTRLARLDGPQRQPVPHRQEVLQ